MPDPASRDRNRFRTALVFFLVWVAALGAMAAFSASRPAPHDSTAPRG